MQWSVITRQKSDNQNRLPLSVIWNIKMIRQIVIIIYCALLVFSYPRIPRGTKTWKRIFLYNQANKGYNTRARYNDYVKDNQSNTFNQIFNKSNRYKSKYVKDNRPSTFAQIFG